MSQTPLPESLTAPLAALASLTSASGLALIRPAGPDRWAVTGTTGSVPVAAGAEVAADLLARLDRRTRSWSSPAAALSDGHPWRGDGRGTIGACALDDDGLQAAVVAWWPGTNGARHLLKLEQEVAAAASMLRGLPAGAADRRSHLEAAHARRQLALLATCSLTLARALEDFEPAMTRLASDIVPTYADYFAVDLVNDAGVERASVAHSDLPADRLHAAVPPPGLVRIAGRGRGLMWPDPRASESLPAATDLSSFHASLNLDSWAVVPVRIGGLTIGTLSIGTIEPRRGLRPSDLETYRELGDRCALAIERVMLHRQTLATARAAQSTAAGLSRAVEAATAVAACRTIGETIEQAAREAFRITGRGVAAARLERPGAPPMLSCWPPDATRNRPAEEVLRVALGGTSAKIDVPGASGLGVLAISGEQGPDGAGRAVGADAYDVDDLVGPEEGAALALLARATGASVGRLEMIEAATAGAERLRTLFDASPMAIFDVGPDGGLHDWNPQAARLLGWDASETSPRLGPAATAAFGAVRTKLEAGATVTGDRIIIHRPSDGARVSVAVAAALVPGPDGTQHLLCHARDTTEQDGLEARLQQQRRMEALGRLAGGVAHDFNNLLTLIIGYADLLAGRLGAEHPSASDVDAIRSAGRKAASFTEQLLTVSRNRVLEATVVELSSVLKELEPVLVRLLGEDITLILDLDPTAGRISINRSQLEQIVLNLVVNARQAMTEGGYLVVATRGLSGAGLEPLAVLAVTDTGVGMDAATAERCFEPLFTTRRGSGGSGLGLAAVYGIVEEAGGSIGVESAPGMGTTMRIMFPTTDRPAVGATEATGPPPQGRVVPTGLVLLVEDDADVRYLAGSVLTAAGYEVIEVAGATEAIERYESLATTLSLLVTDVVMPGTTGRDLAALICASDPTLPVLFMSGYTDHAGSGELAEAAPVNRFLSKPFGPRELLAAVDDLVQGSKR